MGKSHRDNHAARLNRGTVAFAKKVKRHAKKSKCNLCGTETRPHKLEGGLCPLCIERLLQGKSNATLA